MQQPPVAVVVDHIGPEISHDARAAATFGVWAPSAIHNCQSRSQHQLAAAPSRPVVKRIRDQCRSFFFRGCWASLLERATEVEVEGLRPAVAAGGPAAEENFACR